MRTQEAADGKEALELIPVFQPDLVLLDLLMPVMDGMSLLNHLRNDPQYVSLPVVVLTAKELSRSEYKSLKAKTQGILSKGAGVEERLRDALDRVLLGAAAPGALQGAEAGEPVALGASPPGPEAE